MALTVARKRKRAPAWQIDSSPASLAHLRRLAGAMVAGERPAGATALEQVKAVE